MRFEFLTAVKMSMLVFWVSNAVWSRFAGSYPAEAMDFKGDKDSQHAFLRRGSKAGSTMS
jgi:hypothetical protein